MLKWGPPRSAVNSAKVRATRRRLTKSSSLRGRTKVAKMGPSAVGGQECTLIKASTCPHSDVAHSNFNSPALYERVGWRLTCYFHIYLYVYLYFASLEDSAEWGRTHTLQPTTRTHRSPQPRLPQPGYLPPHCIPTRHNPHTRRPLQPAERSRGVTPDAVSGRGPQAASVLSLPVCTRATLVRVQRKIDLPVYRPCANRAVGAVVVAGGVPAAADDGRD